MKRGVGMQESTSSFSNRVVFCLLLLCSVAAAQVFYGSIVGTVEDQTGAVVPGASVTATNKNTGLVLETVTNENGTYSITNVQPGPYDVSVVLEGFKEFVRTGVPITVNAITVAGPTPVTVSLVSVVNDPVSGRRAVYRIVPQAAVFHMVDPHPIETGQGAQIECANGARGIGVFGRTDDQGDVDGDDAGPIGQLIDLVGGHPLVDAAAVAGKSWVTAKPSAVTQVQKTAKERGVNPCLTPDNGFGMKVACTPSCLATSLTTMRTVITVSAIVSASV